MCTPVWCLLLLLLCPGNLEMVLGKTIQSRWHSFELGEEQNILKNFKRHSDGTFSSDLTHHLDKMKAKDFVQWLASTKRKACIRDLIQLEDE